MKKLASILVALATMLITTIAFTAPASAAAKPYHIRNHPDSTNQVYIFPGTGCEETGQYVLYAGEDAQSNSWDSFDIFSERHYFVVKVYNGTTGEHIVTRTYNGLQCVRAYPTNDYLVVVKTL